MKLRSQDALLSAVRSAGKPVAVLVGSPLSMDFSGGGQGVPGVDEIVALVRETIETEHARILPNFDAELDGASGGDAYQRALDFLVGFVGQDSVNEVVRRAVLKACRNPTKFDGVTGDIDDADPSDWWLPRGAAQLGRLLVECGHIFTGPVLTTNFDPLVETAVRKAGGQFVRTIMGSDGNLPSEAEEAPGVHRVVHLHGYWRGSDTLHTPDQLVSERARLTASLKRLLQEHLVIVVGYGGWDDVFTSAFAELLDDDMATPDVLWCFHEHEQLVVEARYARMLKSVRGAITRGRFRAYGGSDCHELFGILQSELASVPTPPELSTCSISGWQVIDEPFLDGLPDLDDDELLRFFDGQVPTWRHAASNRIPRRDVVKNIVEGISSEAEAGRLSFNLLLGAGGEGKTTTLLQIACGLAMRGGWRVLWRTEPEVGLDPGELQQLLRDGECWLLVTDDGDELVRSMGAAMKNAHEAGGAVLHLLVAARDTDWVAAGGMGQPWRSYAPGYSDPTRLRGVTHGDAEKVVAAWASLGDSGLGLLAGVADTERRADVVLEAVRRETGSGEGSFFGGLLDARLGSEGLREHLVPLLTRLCALPIRGSALSLGDALMYVACCHGAGVAGLHSAVLADLLGVNQHRVYRDVVRPLGDEAAAVRSGGYVYTRHRRVAEALLHVAVERLGFDLPELWADVTRRAIAVTKTQHLPSEWFSPIVYYGSKLHRSLPESLPQTVRAETAVAAAQAAVEAKPEWSSCQINLANTLRATKDPAAGAQALANSIEAAKEHAIDWAKNVRGYVFEWGVCEGGAGRQALSAWLEGLSIADQIEDARVDMRRAKLSLAGLGVAFGELTDPHGHSSFVRSLGACAWLGFRTRPDSRTKGYFERHERKAQDGGAEQPTSLDEALAMLIAGVEVARASLNDADLVPFVAHEQLTFKRLADLLG